MLIEKGWLMEVEEIKITVKLKKSSSKEKKTSK
jgi:hypothetical protein